MKRIGVLTGGGDAAGMNPALRAVVRTAWQHGAEVVGIKRGWRGLAEGDFVTMTPGSVSGILDKGGTILRTFRYPEFATPEGTANCCFGGEDYRTLFITARKSLYAVKMAVKGAKPLKAKW